MTRTHPGLLPVAAAMPALLAAYARAPVSDRDGGILRRYSGGALHGYCDTWLYPDDVIQIRAAGLLGKDKQQGAFQANPVPPSALFSRDSCDDYGAEIVERVLPDTSATYLATCPNARPSALHDGTVAVLTPCLPADQGPSDG